MTLTPPPEWAAHAALWTAWPADAELWMDNLASAQAEVAAMIRALASPGPDGRPGDRVRVLASGPLAVLSAEQAVGDVAEVIAAPYGDIWLRDTGPIFTSRRSCQRFRFNGWGGKYELDHDDSVGARIAALAGAELTENDFVLEGGAIDWDGAGTCLTTRECLLNPNRNPGFDRSAVETGLADTLGLERVIWIERGLANDHTDGHVDNIARFVAPGTVVCLSPADSDDPNSDVMGEIAETLRTSVDARGKRLTVVAIPGPGFVEAEDGRAAPASHANFIIGNAAVIVPTYGTPTGEAAVEALRPLFLGRRVVGCSARHLLSGGGAFHCITQQQPAEGGR
ncbi:agmatine deiminase [bacterium]|nr:agmatine deiminase [bacterium]